MVIAAQVDRPENGERERERERERGREGEGEGERDIGRGAQLHKSTIERVTGL